MMGFIAISEALSAEGVHEAFTGTIRFAGRLTAGRAVRHSLRLSKPICGKGSASNTSPTTKRE